MASAVLGALLLLASPATVQAQLGYTTINATITITGYTGPGGTVAIPSTINGLPVTSIGEEAFWNCTRLTSVTIPNSVTAIGDGAFACCGLTSVTIPNSVTGIGIGAFEECPNLTTVMIGNSVNYIGNKAFSGCTSLTAITVDALNSFYSSLAGVLFNQNQTTLIQYPGGKMGSCTIPGSVTSIGGAGSDPLAFGEGAFSYCTNLTSVTIPSSVISIGNAAFADCTSLTNVTIGNGLTSIGGIAFDWCRNLTSVTIPSSVVIIGTYAFNDCTSLTNVSFQGNAPAADSTVFYNDNNATVYYQPGTTGWGVTFGGLPTKQWNPPPQISLAGLGVHTDQFAFSIAGTGNLAVVVEACTDLANPVWAPVGTNTLTGGSSYFSDPQWTNYPGRFYRLRSP